MPLLSKVKDYINKNGGVLSLSPFLFSFIFRHIFSIVKGKTVIEMAAKAYKEQNINNNLATRNDLETVKTELRHETDLIKKDVAHIKEQMVTKLDIEKVRLDITTGSNKIDGVRTELKHEIELVRKDLSTVSTMNKVILGALVTLVISSPGAYNVFQKVHGIFA